MHILAGALLLARATNTWRQTVPSHPVQSLIDLGFTALEAEVYTCLLRVSPATGYRVAQTLGKPAANVYKAFESLEAKGAVFVEHGNTRRASAVPVVELIGALKRDFHKRSLLAEKALLESTGPPDDDRVYQLKKRSQVFERIRAMLGRCVHSVIVDASPEPLEELREDLSEVVAKGVYVGIRTEQPVAIPGAEVEGLALPAEGSIEPWPGQWLNVVVDGREHVVAFLSAEDENVHQAVWSSSAYLSWVFFSGLSCELLVDRLYRLIHEGASNAELAEVVPSFFSRIVPAAPGRQLLLRRFGRGSENTTKRKDQDESKRMGEKP